MTNTPAASVEEAARRIALVIRQVSGVVQGKRPQVELAVAALLADGHLLIDDVPGVGKTLLAKALAASIGAGTRRVQFTPDLLPSDVLGTSVWDASSGAFRFHPGPVFTNVLLCDEINRAPEKTQASLLEAMEERQVSVEGRAQRLPAPFFVIATQNPFEHLGVYELPESQLDRFLLRISLGYPDRQSAIAILDADGAERSLQDLAPVITLDQLRAVQEIVRQIHVAPALKEYIVDLVEATRRSPALRLGASPRATLALLRAGRAVALLAGRTYLTPDDLQLVAEPVLAHRVHAVDFGESDASEVVRGIVKAVPIPVARRATA